MNYFQFLVIVLIVVVHLLSNLPIVVQSFDPDDDAETFSLSDIKPNSIDIPNEAYLPKVESIFIRSRIRFRYSRTKITSTIVNPVAKRSQNVTYTLRIPNEAFISRFEMRIDNGPKIYRATVVKTNDARKMVEFAINEGRSVTLGLIEQSENGFNEVLLKFVIGAKKKVLFNLVYEERLPRINDQYESVIHFVPDYMTNKTIFRVQVVIEENLRLASVNVPLDQEYSNNNATIIRESKTKASIDWSNYNNQNEVKWKYPHSEFIVAYSLEDEISTGQVLLINGYFVHFFAPTDMKLLRKHVIFILDISDSMTGSKMNQTIAAMNNILDELKMDEDFFNIITFSSNIEVWSCFHGKEKTKLYPFPVTPDCKAEARLFIRNIKPHGSTNMHDALVKGLEIAKNVSFRHSEEKRPQSSALPYRARTHKSNIVLNTTLPEDVQSLILFFSDGEPTSGQISKQAILTKVKILNADMSVPIFSLAFGRSADFPFLSKLSSRNRAFARKIYEESDPSFQLTNFYRGISSPVLANLSFKYESASGKLNNYVSTSGYSMAFRGQDVISVGRLSTWPGMNETKYAKNISSTVSGVGRNGRVSFKIPITDCMAPDSCPDRTDMDDKCVEKIFVYLQLKKMMEEMQMLESETYYDDEEYESSMKEMESLRDKVTQLALQNGLITPYTPMIMRTKSIREEELTVVHPSILNSQNSKELEVEVFLGSETPLPKNAKILREYKMKKTEIREQREMNQNSYKKFEIGNATYDELLNILLPSKNETNISTTNTLVFPTERHFNSSKTQK